MCGFYLNSCAIYFNYLYLPDTLVNLRREVPACLFAVQPSFFLHRKRIPGVLSGLVVCEIGTYFLGYKRKESAVKEILSVVDNLTGYLLF